MSVKVTNLPELTSVDAADVFLVVDTSTGSSKKITWANLLPNGIINPSRLALGGATDSVITAETTTSGTFVDLATQGPFVTVDIGANGLALVLAESNYFNSGANEAGSIGYEISGETTVSAVEIAESRAGAATVLGMIHMSGFDLVSGLEPGSNTFKMKYISGTGGTGTFRHRRIIVIPM